MKNLKQRKEKMKDFEEKQRVNEIILIKERTKDLKKRNNEGDRTKEKREDKTKDFKEKK